MCCREVVKVAEEVNALDHPNIKCITQHSGFECMGTPGSLLSLPTGTWNFGVTTNFS